MGRAIKSPFEAVRWQAPLGDDSFMRKLWDRVKGLPKQRREITSLRKAMPSIDLEKVLEKSGQKISGRSEESGCAWPKGAAGQERGHVDDLGEVN